MLLYCQIPKMHVFGLTHLCGMHCHARIDAQKSEPSGRRPLKVKVATGHDLQVLLKCFMFQADLPGLAEQLTLGLVALEISRPASSWFSQSSGEEIHFSPS